MLVFRNLKEKMKGYCWARRRITAIKLIVNSKELKRIRNKLQKNKNN